MTNFHRRAVWCRLGKTLQRVAGFITRSASGTNTRFNPLMQKQIYRRVFRREAESNNLERVYTLREQYDGEFDFSYKSMSVITLRSIAVV